MQNWLTLMMLQKKNVKEHNPRWPKVPNHPCKISIIEGSGFGKSNSLFTVRNHHEDIYKIYLYAKINMKQNISC